MYLKQKNNTQLGKGKRQFVQSIFLSLALVTMHSAYADATTTIPANLLYQMPREAADQATLAQISGSRPDSDGLIDKSLGLKLGRIYISYIDSKATLGYYGDWDKVFKLKQGVHDIRFVADFQTGIYKGSLSFEAKPQQRYQIMSERDPSVKGIQYLFWVEHVTTGEVVSDKVALNPVGASSNVSYMPVIRSN